MKGRCWRPVFSLGDKCHLLPGGRGGQIQTGLWASDSTATWSCMSMELRETRCVSVKTKLWYFNKANFWWSYYSFQRERNKTLKGFVTGISSSCVDFTSTYRKEVFIIVQFLSQDILSQDILKCEIPNFIAIFSAKIQMGLDWKVSAVRSASLCHSLVTAVTRFLAGRKPCRQEGRALLCTLSSFLSFSSHLFFFSCILFAKYVQSWCQEWLRACLPRRLSPKGAVSSSQQEVLLAVASLLLQPSSGCA